MTPTCEVYVDLGREPHIEGKLVTSVSCSYPGCTEAVLNGIVVAFMDMGAVKCRAFCSELHALFILAELSARDLECLGDGEDLVTDMVRRHLAGEVLDGSSQEEIDSDVNRTLGGGSEPAA